ncbi:hypothetical protein SDC9_201934 [bioreactor metagenome]|uniref:Uncharacterized protein n=1 Tax=bioreactor metagenome TaxID=1076179 RepID=A0A645J192_9ZZZZ
MPERNPQLLRHHFAEQRRLVERPQVITRNMQRNRNHHVGPEIHLLPHPFRRRNPERTRQFRVIEEFEAVYQFLRQITVLVDRRRPDPRARLPGETGRTERQRRVQLPATASAAETVEPAHLLFALRAETVPAASVAAAADGTGK